MPARQTLPLSEIIVSILSSGEALKLAAIEGQVDDEFSVHQVKRALRGLVREGRVRHSRFGKYAIVSPYDLTLDVEQPLSEPTFEVIRRCTQAPATFEALARRKFVPRRALWACLCVLVQRGELRVVTGGLTEGTRFLLIQHLDASNTEVTYDLSQSLNRMAIYRMSDLESCTRLTSRMLLNRLKNLLEARIIYSFVSRGRRYVFAPSPTVEPLGIRMEKQPVPIVTSTEFGQTAIDLLLALRASAALSNTMGQIASPDDPEVKWLLRCGLARQTIGEPFRIDITDMGLALVGRFGTAALAL